MPLSKKPVGRLPQHLQHLKRKPERPGRDEDVSDRPAKKARPATSSRPDAKPAPKAEPVAASPDRLTSLIPEVLRALLGPHLNQERSGPIVVAVEDVLAALAPYWRPKSRFEGLMIAKLVGEGYLRPRGARGKNGFSAAYAVTPKAERLLDLRR